jgi:hypothetical protein
MPKLLRMPNLDTLPEGPARDFVELLFDYHHIAHHPTLEQICDQIDKRPEEERAGTASRETVRRMFHGQVPRNWATVEVVFVALCQLAGVDPDRKVKYWEEHDEEVVADRRGQMHDAWSAALYGRPAGKARFQGINFDYEEPEPPASARGGFTDDPWGSGSAFSDKPPF